MRIVAGTWRGRTLIAPPGQGTRPTADRVRQALFDMLMHAEWGGRAAIEGAIVLDVFAGTGALGLEALSRGAAAACFIERDASALRALRMNVAACKAEDRTEILAVDVLMLSRRVRANPDEPTSSGSDKKRKADPASLIFLDPPYGRDLVPRAIATLQDAGRIHPRALIIAETARDDPWVPAEPLLAERHHGAARLLIFRAASPTGSDRE